MHHHWVMKRRGVLTWSSQSRRGVACVSTRTPAWPAGRAGLWGEGWGQVDRPRARAGCWPPTRTAEGRRVCQALQMNPRRYLQRNKTTKKLKRVELVTSVVNRLYSVCTTSVCQMLNFNRYILPGCEHTNAYQPSLKNPVIIFVVSLCRN